MIWKWRLPSKNSNLIFVSEKESPKLAIRLFITAILNVLIAAGMAMYLGEYFVITGGIFAYVIFGSLLTLMNIFIRPVLHLLTLPLRLFATILAIILVNGIFVQLIFEITQYMDPELITLSIEGGIVGWVFVASAFGLANWIMRLSMR